MGQAKNEHILFNLVELCSQWAEERNIIGGSTIKDQVLKLVQEVGELSDNVCKKKDITDDIGDCLVVLNNIALIYGSTLEDCLLRAYEDIKDRKGKIIDGVFVKEADLIGQ